MIFAAGLGTRLKPITDTIPKALLPLNGKTLLQYQIESLKKAGITEMVVNVHHFPDMIIHYLQENNNFGCTIHISDERDRLLDTGGGLLKARRLLQDDTFLACNVDILSNINIPQLFHAHTNAPNAPIATLVVSERQTQRYLLFDETNNLKGWINIATGETRPCSLTHTGYLHPLAFSGMQILSPMIFNLLEEGKGKDRFSLIDAYLSICNTESVKAFEPADYRMMDVGKIDHLKEAEQFAADIY